MATTPGGVTSALVSASASAPTAGATVATTSALGGGATGPTVYIVDVTTYQTGTVDTNTANMALFHGTTQVGTLLSTAVVSRTQVRIAVNSGEAILVKAVGNAGASSVYNVCISATRQDGAYR